MGAPNFVVSLFSHRVKNPEKEDILGETPKSSQFDDSNCLKIGPKKLRQF